MRLTYSITVVLACAFLAATRGIKAWKHLAPLENTDLGKLALETSFDLLEVSFSYVSGCNVTIGHTTVQQGIQYRTEIQNANFVLALVDNFAFPGKDQYSLDWAGTPSRGSPCLHFSVMLTVLSAIYCFWVLH